MTVARITRPGLAAIAVSVTVLWTCLLAERATVRRASQEQAQALQEIGRMRQQRLSRPVSSPERTPWQSRRPAAG